MGTMKNKVSLPSRLGIMLALVVSGCTDMRHIREKNKYDNHRDTKETNHTPNIIKVLNRVQCERSYCDGETSDAIWQICLRNGYQTLNPSSRVSISRDIKELVSGTMPIKRMVTSTSQKTDANGIVTDIESMPVEKTYLIEYRGYCIGSEYIVEEYR